jgi:hypothetical protein
MTKEQIISLNAKKHVKIYLLSKLGLSNKDVAEALKTNAGHVYNVLKDYNSKPEKAEKAQNL